MTRKSIVKHHFTYTTPLYVSSYSDTPYHEGFNYRHHKNFWCDSHPLNELYNKIVKFVPHNGECEDARIEAFRLIMNIHYDTMNKMCNFFCKANKTQTSFFA